MCEGHLSRSSAPARLRARLRFRCPRRREVRVSDVKKLCPPVQRTLLSTSPSRTPITPADECQCSLVVDPDSVYVVLRKLNQWEASGVDDISNYLLKLCAKYIDVPLSHFFNRSLRSGCFPAPWKQARIQPVFKHKGDRSSPGSYRPIALLCSVSKVFESLVNDQVLKFCLANRVIPDCQFGFLSGRSTVWQLLTVCP